MAIHLRQKQRFLNLLKISMKHKTSIFQESRKDVKNSKKKINKQEKRSRLEDDKNANMGIAYYQNYVRFERLSFRKNSF